MAPARSTWAYRYAHMLMRRLCPSVSLPQADCLERANARTRELYSEGVNSVRVRACAREMGTHDHRTGWHISYGI